MGGLQRALSQGSLDPSEWVGATSSEKFVFPAQEQDWEEGEVRAAFSFSSNRIHRWKCM